MVPVNTARSLTKHLHEVVLLPDKQHLPQKHTIATQLSQQHKMHIQERPLIYKVHKFHSLPFHLH